MNGGNLRLRIAVINVFSCEIAGRLRQLRRGGYSSVPGLVLRLLSKVKPAWPPSETALSHAVNWISR